MAAAPLNAQALNQRCWGKATLNLAPESAVADCNDALKLAPDNAAILDSRGFARLRGGAFKEAITDYDAALHRNPLLAGSLYGRGLARYRTGDQTGATEDLARARRLSLDIDARFAGYRTAAPDAPRSPETHPWLPQK